MKISTESETVGLHDKSGDSDIIWTRNFLEAKGYTISTITVYHDNMNTLSLANNSYVFSFKCTKHTKAAYFFIRKYYKVGEIDLQYCIQRCGRMSLLNISKELNSAQCALSS